MYTMSHKKLKLAQSTLAGSRKEKWSIRYRPFLWKSVQKKIPKLASFSTTWSCCCKWLSKGKNKKPLDNRAKYIFHYFPVKAMFCHAPLFNDCLYHWVIHGCLNYQKFDIQKNNCVPYNLPKMKKIEDTSVAWRVLLHFSDIKQLCIFPSSS